MTKKIPLLMGLTLPSWKIYLTTTLNDEVQEQFQFQADYVLPIGEGSQFEAGYKGNFNNLNKDYTIFSVIMEIMYNFLSNTLEYKEKINAFYTIWFQSKFFLFIWFTLGETLISMSTYGYTRIQQQKYNKFFPSAFATYEISRE
jgi:hypothetical protein